MPDLSLLSLISRNPPKRSGMVSPELDKSGPGLRLFGLAGIDKPEAQAKAFSKSWNDLGLRFRLVIDSRHGSTSASSQVTRAGWLGSSWRQPASPQRGSLGSGGVALRASTPATPRCNLLLNHA